jgi:hypothetical protein
MKESYWISHEAHLILCKAFLMLPSFLEYLCNKKRYGTESSHFRDQLHSQYLYDTPKIYFERDIVCL